MAAPVQLTTEPATLTPVSGTCDRLSPLPVDSTAYSTTPPSGGKVSVTLVAPVTLKLSS